MTITKADFLSRLPGAVAGTFDRLDDEFRGGDGERDWRLRIMELPGRRLGALALERLALEFEFRGFSLEERDVFLARFRQHYHRGGG